MILARLVGAAAAVALFALLYVFVPTVILTIGFNLFIGSLLGLAPLTFPQAAGLFVFVFGVRYALSQGLLPKASD